MTKTIDDMKAELEANGYVLELHHLRSVKSVTEPSEVWTVESAHWTKSRLIEEAYRHLQERRELEALRAFVLDFSLRVDNQDVIYDISASRDIVKQFNITADESESDET